MDSRTPFSPAPQDEAPDAISGGADFQSVEFVNGVVTDASPSHADALRQLVFHAELREFNRGKALERILAWGEAYQDALGLASAELDRVSQWSRHHHEKISFRGDSYETFYRFAVPAGLLGPHPVEFGLVFFTVTLAGRKSRLVLAPLCLNSTLADAYHHGTGAKSDVVFYAREDVHEAILTTLGGKMA